MHQASISCITASRIQACRSVLHLTNAGFAYNEISVLLSCGPDRHAASWQEDPAAPSRAVVPTELEPGGVVGWLTDVGVFSLPGLGHYALAGPISAALGGPTANLNTGVISDTLQDLGFSLTQAMLFLQSAAAGNVLVSVLARSSRELEAAGKIFHAVGAIHVVTAEKDGTSSLAHLSFPVSCPELSAVAG